MHTRGEGLGGARECFGYEVVGTSGKLGIYRSPRRREA